MLFDQKGAVLLMPTFWQCACDGGKAVTSTCGCRCSTCHGTREIYEKCRFCNRNGTFLLFFNCPFCNHWGSNKKKCERCRESGSSRDGSSDPECPDCRGRGRTHVKCVHCAETGQADLEAVLGGLQIVDNAFQDPLNSYYRTPYTERNLDEIIGVIKGFGQEKLTHISAREVSLGSNRQDGYPTLSIRRVGASSYVIAKSDRESERDF